MTKKAKTRAETIAAKHAKLTGKGSFYDNNGGRFRGQNKMTPEEELAYVASLIDAEGPAKPPERLTLIEGQVLTLKAGDTVVISYPGALTLEQSEMVRDAISAQLPPEVGVLILSNGAQMVVQRVAVDITGPTEAAMVAEAVKQMADRLPELIAQAERNGGLAR